MTDRTDDDRSRGLPTSVDRRSVLKMAGAGAALGSLQVVSADTASSAQRRYTLIQGDTCIKVEPFTGEETVEELYGLQIPDAFGGDNGATDEGGPYYSSLGTTDLQRPSTTITFMYEGPKGLSVVVVHGDVEGNSGAVSWEVSQVPLGAEWAVKDDLYLNAFTGEPVVTNYDRWDVSGTTHEIDWTWDANHTDGGALRLPDRGTPIRIDPAFNQEAELWNTYYDGDVTDWEFLSSSGGGVERFPMGLDQPLTIRTGPCSYSDGDGGSGDASDDNGGDNGQGYGGDDGRGGHGSGDEVGGDGQDGDRG